MFQPSLLGRPSHQNQGCPDVFVHGLGSARFWFDNGENLICVAGLFSSRFRPRHAGRMLMSTSSASKASSLALEIDLERNIRFTIISLKDVLHYIHQTLFLENFILEATTNLLKQATRSVMRSTSLDPAA